MTSNLRKMIIRFVTAVLLTTLTSEIFSQDDLRYKLEKLLQKPEYVNATCGISVIDIETGKPIYSFNEDKLMIPASVLKIVTSASAMEMLGPDFRFKTYIGFSGDVSEEGTLSGDLVVIGGGDPTLGSEYFYSTNGFASSWAQKIKSFGIKNITGNIVFDGSVYDSEKIPPTWLWGDIGNYYGAGTSAFTCYDNLFRIAFKSPKEAGQRTEIISVTPKIENLKIVNEVISSDDARDLAYVFGSPFDNLCVIKGTIPKDKNSFTIKASIHQPEMVLSSELLKGLENEGILLNGKVKFDNMDKNQFKTIFVHESPNLSEIAKILNYQSVNLYAEHLLMQIAVERKGIGSRGKGIDLIKEFWKSKGIFEGHFFMEDGSGLSHFNAISPLQISSILLYMISKSNNRNDFINSLPPAGKGTLAAFSPSFFPGNTLQAKSGSMTRVRSYAGCLHTDSGKEIVFAIMFNHFSASQSKLLKDIESLLLTIKKTM